MHQMRAVSLTAYLEVARFVGLDGRRMLREAGISPADLEDPDNRLPASRVVLLLDRSARESHCESFGLLMARARTFASLGPVSLLLERLPNPREVAKANIAFRHHFSDIASISLEEEDETTLIRLDVLPAYWSVQLFDHSLAMVYRALRGASGNRWQPACVHLMRPKPQEPSPWRRYYAVPVEFGASCNGLSSSPQAMLIPNPLADAEMARNARKLLHLVPLEREPRAVSDRVRRVITLLLPSGRATLEQVSAQLGFAPRSLQRRLGQESRSFADELDAVRRDLAKGYLADSTLPVTAIAPLLGYASPSSFTRWFASAFGLSPQAWRAAESRAARTIRAGPASAARH